MTAGNSILSVHLLFQGPGTIYSDTDITPVLLPAASDPVHPASKMHTCTHTETHTCPAFPRDGHVFPMSSHSAPICLPSECTPDSHGFIA